MSIDDFYKAVAYTLIYKGYNRKVDELPIENITLTIFRHSYPRELIKALRRSGFVVKEEYPGIFYIDGKVNFGLQLIVSSRLPNGEYEGLRLLAKGCTRDAVIHYAKEAAASGDENVKTNAGTVIGICLDINRSLGSQFKEDSSMNDVIRDIFKKAFDEAKQEGIQEGVHEEKERVAADMLKKKLPLQLIEEISKLSEDTIRSLAKSLGVAVM